MHIFSGMALIRVNIEDANTDPRFDKEVDCESLGEPYGGHQNYIVVICIFFFVNSNFEETILGRFVIGYAAYWIQITNLYVVVIGMFFLVKGTNLGPFAIGFFTGYGVKLNYISFSILLSLASSFLII